MRCCVVVCVSTSVFVVCAIAVFLFLVSPILVNHFCCLLCFSFRERSDWKRVVVSPSGSSSSVVSSKVTCVPCLFVQFLFYLLSCHSSQDWSSGSGIGWLCAQRCRRGIVYNISGLFVGLTLLVLVLVLCSVCVGLGFGPGPSLVLCIWSFPCIALILVLCYLYGACPCCVSVLRCVLFPLGLAESQSTAQ